MATSSIYCADNSDLESAGSSLDESDVYSDYSDEEFEPESDEDVEESSSGNFYDQGDAQCIILACPLSRRER